MRLARAWRITAEVAHVKRAGKRGRSAHREHVVIAGGVVRQLDVELTARALHIVTGDAQRTRGIAAGCARRDGAVVGQRVSHANVDRADSTQRASVRKTARFPQYGATTGRYSSRLGERRLHVQRARV